MPVPANRAFWSALESLIAGSRVIVDRPRGSTHPRYPELVYPLDYGYLEGTRAADGGGIDLWLGSLPDRRLAGVLCTVDSLKRDAEIKLLLGCSDQDIHSILAVTNGASMQAELLLRPE